ncbi:MAG: hypothetical protein Q4Q58_01120 [Thermoplasmata archaeon]|nr:hypothetical protein [Thermoplasmata archaeon]
MAGKKRIRMRGVKHTSKRQEDELLEKARELSANPGLLRPQCAGNCRKCAFDKPFKQIDGLAKIKGNPDALIKEASRLGGDDIVRAYAGTVSLAASGTVPLLASGKLGGETVSYAVRGTVNATKLIGCQYYDDPKKRLLLYSDTVKKNRLHLYSFGEDLVCSDTPNMPEDYLYDTFWETPYEFPEDGLSCGHETSAVLEIHVKSLGETVSICENCARNTSTLMYIVSRLAAVDPMDDIEVRIRHKFHSAGEKDVEPITGDRLKDYMVGKVTDENLISSVKRARLGQLKDAGSATYIVGTKNYGSDLDSFISALEGDARELATLKKYLSSSGRAVVVKAPKCSEALSYLWDDWRGIVAAHTDQKTADSLGDMSKGQPGVVLADAYGIFVSADVVASLPEFKRPGPVTQLADKFAKAAKVGGSSMVLETAGKASLKDNRSRSVAAAFMLATGAEPSIKLSNDERDLAEYLVPFAKNVIAAGGEKYRDTMNTLLTACGANEKVS